MSIRVIKPVKITIFSLSYIDIEKYKFPIIYVFISFVFLIEKKHRYLTNDIGDRMKLFSHRNLLRFGFAFIMLQSVINNSIAQQLSSYELWKGVVIDANNTLLYTSNPSGGMDGITISSGEKKWHTDSADRPIVIQGSKIISHRDTKQGGILPLVNIESVSGVTSESRSIELPPTVVARVADSLNQHFNINTIKNKTSLQSIQWHYRKDFIQGISPESPKKNKPIFGEVSLNASGLLADVNTTILAKRPLSINTAIEGNFLNAIKGRQFKSISGNHILVSKRKQDPALWEKYQWDIYDLSGQLLGSINNASSYISFHVVDDLILFINLPFIKNSQNNKYEEPLSLQAYSLNTGQRIWQHEIRDFTYKGPYPQ